MADSRERSESQEVKLILQGYLERMENPSEPTTSQKVKMMLRFFSREGPVEGVKTLVTDADLLPNGVSAYEFDAYAFWISIAHNFVAPKQ